MTEETAITIPDDMRAAFMAFDDDYLADVLRLWDCDLGDWCESFAWHFSTSPSCSRPVILSKPSMGPPPFVCCLAGGVLAMGARCESEQACVPARRRRPRRV